jgi:DNA-binding transcriptional regulator YhcF (GntR family)
MHSSVGSRPSGPGSGSAEASRLSYKFQRLREQLRSAILNGELSGRLPGERTLGRRYEANAKTINKALCDLSSEGLVVRRIGRGTFVVDPASGAAANSIRVYSCLMPDAVGTAGHRALLIERLRATLAAAGHRLMLTSLSDLSRSAWKATAERTASSGLAAPGTVPQVGFADGGPAHGGNGHVASRRGGGRDAAGGRPISGVFCYPADPLGASLGEPSEELIAEALRRQSPLVLIGTDAAAAKLCAVLTDYGDAGFRLTEHLLRAGCTRIEWLFAAAGGRCQAQALAGARTAMSRAGQAALHSDVCGPATLVRIAGITGSATGGATGGAKVGLVAVGAALEPALRDAVLSAARGAGRLMLAALGEAGDKQPSAAGVTSYEVDAGRLAAWAAKLAMEHRPGQRPVEVLVPGLLVVRDETAVAATTAASALLREAVV